MNVGDCSHRGREPPWQSLRAAGSTLLLTATATAAMCESHFTVT
jgi:hypothetical protein